MNKLLLIDDDWQEVILQRKDNPKAFDSIIEQKISRVKKILLPDWEWWTLWVSNNKIILIN